MQTNRITLIHIKATIAQPRETTQKYGLKISDNKKSIREIPRSFFKPRSNNYVKKGSYKSLVDPGVPTVFTTSAFGCKSIAGLLPVVVIGKKSCNRQPCYKLGLVN